MPSPARTLRAAPIVRLNPGCTRSSRWVHAPHDARPPATYDAPPVCASWLISASSSSSCWSRPCSPCAWATGKYRTDWDECRGWLPERPAPTAGRPRVWIHAVSVGEMNAVRGLITAWQQCGARKPKSSSPAPPTPASPAPANSSRRCCLRYPLDFSRFVRLWLDRIRPDLIVLVELEVWFNFVTMAAARYSRRRSSTAGSAKKLLRMFAKVCPIARRMFRSLDGVGAEDEAYACPLPAPSVSPPTASTSPARSNGRRPRSRIRSPVRWSWRPRWKFEPAARRETVKTHTLQLKPGYGPVPDSGCVTGLPEEAFETIDVELLAYPIWVCGSTGPGEEEIILDAFKQLRLDPDSHSLQLILVPRKPERFDEVARLIEQNGFLCVRRSKCPDGSLRSYDENAVHLVDTMGELRKVYSLADVVFVGRWCQWGSDMMEVAARASQSLLDPIQRIFATRCSNCRPHMQSWSWTDHRSIALKV